MTDDNCGTGRTTAAVVRALQAHRAGAKVLFVVLSLHSERYVQSLFRQLGATFEETRGIEIVSVSDIPCRIRGHRFQHVEIDHAADEMVTGDVIESINAHRSVR